MQPVAVGACQEFARFLSCEGFTTKAGHWLALGINPGEVVDWNHQVRDGLVDKCLDQVHRVGGLCVAAHPHAPYPSGDFMFPFRGFDVVEVWNGLWTSDRPWNADNEAALAEWGRSLAADIRTGSWRPAMGNSDTHLEGQIGIPHSVVFAEELSTEAVLAGIRAGRSWIAESADVDVSFTANADGRVVGVGERLATHGGQVEVQAAVRGVPVGTVSFHTDRGKGRLSLQTGRAWCNGTRRRSTRRSFALRSAIPTGTSPHSPIRSSSTDRSLHREVRRRRRQMRLQASSSRP
ncbi:CehA/McbA family metallohydrolase [Streptomyces sp. CB01635]|uniref:CehA/McbA family metallohydrolase n=1 Tax=unclassified Streptomyces TaxID=2593676 RepID=UPI001F47B99F|nr:CehA/McbA family metallohydrolase [Streptomyces sp. CB01635]